MYLQPPKKIDYNIISDKPKLSVLVPGIRPEYWTDIYNSIIGSTSSSFELILITPYPYAIEPALLLAPNFKVIKDYGSPVRAHAIGAAIAEGELITWISDDGFFVPYGLETALARLDKMGNDIKNIVTYKFTENEKVYTDEYYKINFHKDKEGNGIGSEHIPDDYFILNSAIMYREYYDQLGGINCDYECTALAYTDLAIRAQADDANVQLLEGIPILMCTQQNDNESHGIIHDAQITHDEPLYNKTYKKATWKEELQINLDVKSQWKKADTLWSRKWKSQFESTDTPYAYLPLGDDIRSMPPTAQYEIIKKLGSPAVTYEMKHLQRDKNE